MKPSEPQSSSNEQMYRVTAEPRYIGGTTIRIQVNVTLVDSKIVGNACNI